MVTAKVQTLADSVSAYLKDHTPNGTVEQLAEKASTSVNKYSSYISSNEYVNLQKTLKSSCTASNDVPLEEDFFHTFKVKDVDVPVLLREPYILTGYMLPEKPIW